MVMGVFLLKVVTFAEFTLEYVDYISQYNLGITTAKNQQSNQNNIYSLSDVSLLPIVISTGNSDLPAISFTTDSAALNIEDMPLVYPNPFSIRTGGQIQYKLSKPANISLRIYNMLGRQIYREDFNEGENGGSEFNTIEFNTSKVSGFNLPSGVYIGLIINNGKVLGKLKLGIVE